MKKTATATSPVHFVTGTDDGAVRKSAAALVQKLAPDADVFGLETIDGDVDIEEAEAVILRTIQGLLTLPLFGGRKLIWLKNASFLAKGEGGGEESLGEAMDALRKALESGLPDGVTFLLSASRVDKRRTFFQFLSQHATTHLHDLPKVAYRDEESIIEWVARNVRRRDLQLEPAAVEVLAARVGVDSLQLESELDKLEISFGKAGLITTADVRDLAPQTREGSIFDLSEAIAKRNLPLALQTLDHLFRQAERAIGILLTAIVPTVRNLLLAKDLLVKYKLPPPAQWYHFASALKGLPAESVSHLPRKKDGMINFYPLGIAAANGGHYSLAELEAGFAACVSANQQLLGGPLPERIVLERLLVEMLSRKS